MKQYIIFSLCLVATDISPMHLFNEFPSLRETIGHTELADLPSRLDYCKDLSVQLSGRGSEETEDEWPTASRRDALSVQVYCKDDGDIGMDDGQFGGNKLRKAEFIFGDVLRQRYKSVETAGSAGTNHGVAMASCAQRLGMSCNIYLKPQANSWVVRRNLLLMHHYGAHLFEDEMPPVQNSQVYRIPVGASNELGTLGFVNAALELETQLKLDGHPHPDRIYVPVGSAGTAAGLALGLKMAGMKSTVVAARAVNNPREERIADLFQSTNVLLSGKESTIPIYECDNVEVRNELFSGVYGLPTRRVNESIGWAKEHADLVADPTYMGYAVAAMREDVKKGLPGNGPHTLLLWNTFCNYEGHYTDDWTRLPYQLHSYFEETH